MIPKKYFIFLLTVLIFATGCVSVKPKESDGGIFKSTDKAQTWEQKVFVSEGKKAPITIAGVSVKDVVFHPDNPEIIYLATRENGLYKTQNSGDVWQATGINNGGVDNITINPKNPEEIYVTRGNQVAKSTNGGQIWNIVYTETRGVNIMDIEVDAYTTERLYIILETGELVKSPNGGISWSIYKTFEYKVVKILIDPRDSRKIYVFTEKNGFFKSVNLGLDWKHIHDELQEFEHVYNYKDVIFDFTRPDSLLYASGHGLLRSLDGGYTWQALNLLTPPGSMEIYTVAQNPLSDQEIYYTTPQGMYMTFDGGESWTVKTLPTSQIPKFIRIDPLYPDILYMGTYKPAKKKSGFF